MLTGDKIKLRPLRFEDWKKTISWRTDTDLTQMVMSQPFPITDELEKEWFESELKNKSNKSVYFGIEELSTKELIGFIFLNNFNWINRTCQLGILIGAVREQGKGYGTETMNLIIKYAFNTLNLRKITLEVIDTNDKAQRLYEKLGFKIEGRLKNHYFSEKDYHDILIYSLFDK